MREQFVSYETALRLKNLGFDEKCFASYYKNRDINFIEVICDVKQGWEGYTRTTLRSSSYSHKEWEYDNWVFAPLYQQVVDWLDSKEVLLFAHLYSRLDKQQWSWSILHIDKHIFDEYNSPVTFNTRQEALIAGIEKCLTLLENNT